MRLRAHGELAEMSAFCLESHLKSAIGTGFDYINDALRSGIIAKGFFEQLLAGLREQQLASQRILFEHGRLNRGLQCRKPFSFLRGAHQ